MNIINLRKDPRRSVESRRIVDRRKVPYEFGSPQWIENIKQNYLAWPIRDRRVEARRNDERRNPDRRHQQLSEQRRSEKKFSRIVLTPEELKLIEDLYMNEAD
ncbi:MAG: hypothetical protein ABL903_13640 [Methylococcales bacterium]